MSPLAEGESSDVSLGRIRRWVHERLGLGHEPSQESTFRVRVMSYCQRSGVRPEQLAAALEREEQPFVVGLAEEVSTNHTTFFREPDTFDLFMREILPQLPRDTPLRFWSAAASSGEEAYSIAFCIREILGAGAKDARVLGTDISARQLRIAERAEYTRDAVARRPGIARLFEPTGAELCRVPESIRAMCTFRRMNLIRVPWPFTRRFHVVFLRNVLYYFEPHIQQRVVEACFDVVEPGGWLVTSTTEPMLDALGRWERVCPGIQRKARR